MEDQARIAAAGKPRSTKHSHVPGFPRPSGPAVDRNSNSEDLSKKRKLAKAFGDDEKRGWDRKPVCSRCWAKGEKCDYGPQCKSCIKASQRCVHRLCSRGSKCGDRRCPGLHPEQYDKSNLAWHAEEGDLGEKAHYDRRPGNSGGSR